MKKLTHIFTLLAALMVSATVFAGVEYGNGILALDCDPAANPKDDCVATELASDGTVQNVNLKKVGRLTFKQKGMPQLKVRPGKFAVSKKGALSGFTLDQETELTFKDGKKKKIAAGKKVFLTDDLKVEKAE